ncbi:MAG: hypothetical protein R3Y59_09710 [bacterium]
MDIHYNFSKDEIQKDEKLIFWFNNFATGVNGRQIFCPPSIVYPYRELKSNFYSTETPPEEKQQMSSIYLLNDINKCKVIAEKSCIMIGSIGEEISVIDRLIINDTERLCCNIDWEDYLQKLPLSDIIICDNHYFKNLHTYKSNDNVIIKTLSSIPKQSPVNLIIIVKEREISPDIDLETECNEIKKIIKKASESKKSTVTILTTNRAHDRHIISNYFRVKCGSCLHIKDNSLKKDVTVETKSHALKNNLEITLKLLEEFQIIAKNPVKVFGDKVSNLLQF